MWRSLVAHPVWDRGTVGSNPSTPTNLQTGKMVQAVKFERPSDAQDLLPHIKYAAGLGLNVVEKDCHAGEKCLLVGTGPTLKNKDVFRQIKHFAKTHVVIGLKESVPYLKSKGINVTYSVSMDPGGKRQIARTPPDRH